MILLLAPPSPACQMSRPPALCYPEDCTRNKARGGVSLLSRLRGAQSDDLRLMMFFSRCFPWSSSPRQIFDSAVSSSRPCLSVAALVELTALASMATAFTIVELCFFLM